MRYSPGFTHKRRGTASYSAALRATPRSKPAWTCKHDHLTAQQATACAAAEWDRRNQGEREVLEFLNCKVCGTWTPVDLAAGTILTCGRCGVPRDIVKVIAVERVLP